jgi:hypothetical protein
MKFDYCTIVGKNPKIFEKHALNVIDNAGLARDLWDFHVIVYKNSKIAPETTDEILSICNALKITAHIYQEVEHTGPGDPYFTFLHNLYVCWNACQTVGNNPLSVRAGSDQAFSPNAFKNMIEAWTTYQNANKNDNVVMFHNLIESKKNVTESRHILEDFGTTWDNFDKAGFENWCADNQALGLHDWESANRLWGAPRDMKGLASNGRADGASWIQSKALFKKYGPMPVFYPNGLTGDIGICEVMRTNGVKFYIIGNSTTYHFSRSGG